MAFRNTNNTYVVRIHTRDKKARLQFESSKGYDVPLDEMPARLRKLADQIEKHFNPAPAQKPPRPEK